MNLPTITLFYELSEILDDDLYKVCNAIKAYYKDDTYFSEIMQDISCPSEDRIVKYKETIETLMELPYKQLKEVSIGIQFIDNNAYIKYLHHLLSLNNIPFAPFMQKECKKQKEDNVNLFSEIN